MTKRTQTRPAIDAVPTITKAEEAKFLTDNANRATLEWFDLVIRNHEQGVKALKDRREQFIEATAALASGMLASPVNVVSWAVNDVSNIAMNNRLDLAVNRAQELTQAAAHGKE